MKTKGIVKEYDGYCGTIVNEQKQEYLLLKKEIMENPTGFWPVGFFGYITCTAPLRSPRCALHSGQRPSAGHRQGRSGRTRR